MVDNFELIKPLLSWENEDTFYFVQVIKRKKENPELGSNSYVANTYYIRSMEHLENRLGEMKVLADYHNARVCINLNKRSFRKMAYHSLKKVTDQLLNGDYLNVRRAYPSVCGMYANGDKTWVVDIDEKTVPEGMVEFINNLEPIGNKVLLQLPTKNGIHLITKPFRADIFGKQYPNIEVHKNNPTILYIP